MNFSDAVTAVKQGKKILSISDSILFSNRELKVVIDESENSPGESYYLTTFDDRLEFLTPTDDLQWEEV